MRTRLGWRRAGGVAVVTGTCLASLTALAGPAQAAESDTFRCAAGGYRAEVTVNYHQRDATTYIDGVAVDIDQRAGNRNRVRFVVRYQDQVAFSYTSGNNVTAGPYSFDYRDHPIPVRSDSLDDIQTSVAVAFDVPGGTAKTCNTTVQLAST